MRTPKTNGARTSIPATNARAERQPRVGLRSSHPLETERAALAEWYAQGLQPKLSRAVRAGTVNGAQAAALEHLMADLLAGCGHGPGRSGR